MNYLELLNKILLNKTIIKPLSRPNDSLDQLGCEKVNELTTKYK